MITLISRYFNYFRQLIVGFIFIMICSLVTLPTFADDPPVPANAGYNPILNMIMNLTCETKGIGNLLRSQFSHTCFNSTMLDLVAANILSPGTYANAMLKLKINDNDLFPGNCDKDNRADPYHLTLSFATCNTYLLEKARLEKIGDIILAIAEAMATGSDPWPAIQKAWNGIHKSDYHLTHPDVPLNVEGSDTDLSLIPVSWKVVQIKDKICVATTSVLFPGYIQVGCKYIREPFPKSMYSNFMDPKDTPVDPKLPPVPTQNDPRKLTLCTGIDQGGCYQRVQAASKTGLIITSPIIECIQQMLAKLMISEDVCRMEDVDKVMSTGQRDTSSFFLFQKNMRKIVSALITIYAMFFGLQMMLSPGNVTKVEIINFVLKILFVTFFSVGLTGGKFNNSDLDRVDGITSVVLPFLLSGLQEMGGWVSSSPSAGNGLCVFNSMEYSPSNMSYLALWDAVDCRLSHYLGLDMLSSMLAENYARMGDFKNFDFFSFAVPPYYYLLIPAILTGDTTLFSLALMYPVLVISIIAYLVNSTVVCMIGIVILSFLSPLMVPMYLFSYTRGYFDNWAKLLISYMLQPMIVVTFMIVLFTVYDYGFYGKCQYKVAHMSLDPTVQTLPIAKVFYIDDAFDDRTVYSAADAESCQTSLGYMINHPLTIGRTMTTPSIKDAVGHPENDVHKFMDKFNFLQGIIWGPGLLVSSPTVVYHQLVKVVLALLIACFTLYLMKEFSEQISEFAADLSLGVSLSSVTLNPKATFDKLMSAIGAAAGAAQGGDVKPPGGKEGGAGGPEGSGGKEEGGGSDEEGGDSEESDTPSSSSGGGSSGGSGGGRSGVTNNLKEEEAFNKTTEGDEEGVPSDEPPSSYAQSMKVSEGARGGGVPSDSPPVYSEKEPFPVSKESDKGKKGGEEAGVPSDQPPSYSEKGQFAGSPGGERGGVGSDEPPSYEKFMKDNKGEAASEPPPPAYSEVDPLPEGKAGGKGDVVASKESPASSKKSLYDKLADIVLGTEETSPDSTNRGDQFADRDGVKEEVSPDDGPLSYDDAVKEVNKFDNSPFEDSPPSYDEIDQDKDDISGPSSSEGVGDKETDKEGTTEEASNNKDKSEEK